MAKLGHDVIGVDIDPAKVASLSAGVPPFWEPGLAELLDETLATGRLRFSSEIADAAGSRVHFVAVGTPQRRGENAADLRHVDSAIDGLLPILAPGDLVVGKSTGAGRHGTAARGTPRRLRMRVRAWPGTPSFC